MCVCLCVIYICTHMYIVFYHSVVRVQSPRLYNPSGKIRVLAVDCGMKNNQIRCLVNRGASVKVVPWDYNFNNDTGSSLSTYANIHK